MMRRPVLGELTSPPMHTHACAPAGTYTFKGCDRPLDMAHFVLEGLLPRCSRFPSEPPRGKGCRLSAAAAEIGVACIRLPCLVPHHEASPQVRCVVPTERAWSCLSGRATPLCAPSQA